MPSDDSFAPAHQTAWSTGLVTTPGCFTAGLVAAGPAAPVLAGLITVLAATRPLAWNLPDGHPLHWLLEAWRLADQPLVASGLNLGVAWLVLATLLWLLGFTAAHRVNQGSFNNLRDQYRALLARWRCMQRQQQALQASQALGALEFELVMTEVDAHVKAIECELRRPGVRWVLGSPYVYLWNRLKRAEEALICVEPRERVLVGAQNDELRLSDSRIANRDYLRESLALAVARLRGLHEAGTGPGSSRRQAPPVAPASSRDINGAAGPAAATAQVASRVDVVAAPGSQGRVTGVLDDHPWPCSVRNYPASDGEARAVLRQVRHSINEYRSDCWAGLVRVRNHLSGASVFTGVAVYALLWLAIVAGADRESILGAATIFLVGTIVGFFNHCYTDSQTDGLIDDYGLSTARLIATPVLSGVAAVAGVATISLLTVTHNVASLPPTESLTSFGSFFNLQTHPFSLVIAATFGLTPGLLVARLTRQTEELKADLKTSAVARGSGLS